MKVLLEMRPALDGHAGIPQETRLLFRGLAKLDGVEVEGLIQSSTLVLAKGLPTTLPGRFSLRRALPLDKQINRLSRVVVSLIHSVKPSRVERVVYAVQVTLATVMLLAKTLLGMRQPLSRFDPTRFRDFIWRSLFAKTLPYEDFESVTHRNFRIAQVPWMVMHVTALITRKFGHALYPKLDTRGFDLMIAETPYPGTVLSGTRMVVRYHDAIPLLMPHTISDRSYHQASHYNALRRNIEDGAWFACVSEATRRDLIEIFPQAEARSLTIYNMVSHHYFAEDSPADRIPDIIRTRKNTSVKMPSGTSIRGLDHPAGGLPLQYLLMVSTIEPRKNHLTLLAAWEQLRNGEFPNLHLVFVGSLGWDHKGIVKKLRPWLTRGGLHMLEDVPSGELRQLYRHASVTVCPSFGEGFDFSGVEAMRCGGVVAASDIPVHREVYGEASEYFSPYSAGELAQAVRKMASAGAEPRREELRQLGAGMCARYLPERILPEWAAFLAKMS
ncbi:MAG: glycosyltransferase family 1 protein [Pseudomonadota bacterium]